MLAKTSPPGRGYIDQLPCHSTTLAEDDNEFLNELDYTDDLLPSLKIIPPHFVI
jgi:hypothetical protein